MKEATKKESKEPLEFEKISKTSVSTPVSTNQQAIKKVSGVRHLAQIEDFKLNRGVPITILDSFGWLFYKLVVVFVFLMQWLPFYKKRQENKVSIEPPGPESHPFIGNFPELAANGLVDFTDQLWKKYGQEGIFQYKLGVKPVYLVTKPEYVKIILLDNETFIRGDSLNTLRYFVGDSLVTLEGEKWKKKSLELFPYLSPKRIKQYYEHIIAVGQITQTQWLIKAKETSKIADLLREAKYITIDVIGRSLFNMDFHQQNDAIPKAIDAVVANLFNSFLFIAVAPSWVREKFPTKSFTEFKRTRQILQDELNKAIQNYITHGQNKGDYYIDERIKQYESNSSTFNEMLVNDVLDIFLAGHDTIANLVSWTLFELSKNPQVCQNLYFEIDSVLQGSNPKMEDLEKLPYLSKVIQESLRLYSGAGGVRDVTKDTQLGPYLIKKGSRIQVIARLMGKDPKIWDKPEEFNPDRFEKEIVNKRDQYEFIPFLTGIHWCPGRHLALLEAKIILTMLLQKFEFQLANQEPVKAIIKSLIQEPDRPIELTISQRKSFNYVKSIPVTDIFVKSQEVSSDKFIGQAEYRKQEINNVVLSDYNNIGFKELRHKPASVTVSSNKKVEDESQNLNDIGISTPQVKKFN